MFSTIAAIAAGGAIGAVLRHYMNNAVLGVFKTDFPAGIMAVNILGCFIMGVLVAFFAAKGTASPEIKLFLTVGILGGFTTFSSFSLNTMELWTRGDVTGTAIYVMGSVVLSIAAVFAGSALVWKFVS